MGWSLKITRSSGFTLCGGLPGVLPELSSEIGFNRTIQIAISDGPRLERKCNADISVQTAVTNAVRDVFGQLIQVGNGLVLFLPECNDNAAIVNVVLSRIEIVKATMFVGSAQNQGDNSMAAFWNLLHPEIVKVAKTRFETSHLADAVEASLKEVNDRVKKLYKDAAGEELDGADLMYKTFSVKQPILVLGDLDTATGRDMQQGYMQIFAGTMIGIRNPKAHANITIDARRAIHFLFLASLLMFKIDEAEVRSRR